MLSTKIIANIMGAGWSWDEELLEAEKIDDGSYVIQSIPYYAYGLNKQDVVSVTRDEDKLYVSDVKKRGGHSTLRIIFANKELTLEGQLLELKEILNLGCVIDKPFFTMYAIDVPPSVDVGKVIEYLKKGESKKKWQYEEGYVHKEK